MWLPPQSLILKQRGHWEMTSASTAATTVCTGSEILLCFSSHFCRSHVLLLLLAFKCSQLSYNQFWCRPAVALTGGAPGGFFLSFLSFRNHCTSTHLCIYPHVESTPTPPFDETGRSSISLVAVVNNSRVSGEQRTEDEDRK